MRTFDKPLKRSSRTRTSLNPSSLVEALRIFNLLISLLISLSKSLFGTKWRSIEMNIRLQGGRLYNFISQSGFSSEGDPELYPLQHCGPCCKGSASLCRNSPERASPATQTLDCRRLLRYGLLGSPLCHPRVRNQTWEAQRRVHCRVRRRYRPIYTPPYFFLVLSTVVRPFLLCAF
jgi:hypothetical protein